MTSKYRLITRSDFDGLVCAVLLKELDLIDPDEILFVHPKDMQDGKIEVTNRDITTNLPYVEGVHLAFDHHASEIERVGGHRENHIIDPIAMSAARVVYDHYGGEEALPNVDDEMMDAVDTCDAAQLSKEQILNPGVGIEIDRQHGLVAAVHVEVRASRDHRRSQIGRARGRIALHAGCAGDHDRARERVRITWIDQWFAAASAAAHEQRGKGDMKYSEN